MKDQRVGWPSAPLGAEAGGACAAAVAAPPDVSLVAAPRFIEDTVLLREQAGHPRMAGGGLKLVEGRPQECRVRVRELVARWKEREGREGA